MIKFKHRGNFSRTEKLFKSSLRDKARIILNSYGREGVVALASATPVDSGLTADSWDYEILATPNGFRLIWTNSNMNQNVLIAVLIQYGHGLQNGSYIEGRDFINPVIRPIFDKISENLWKEVEKL